MDSAKLKQLAECAVEMANEMRLSPIAVGEAENLFQRLLYAPQQEQGRESWNCLQCGIITEIELRNLLMAHCATQIKNSAAVDGLPYPTSFSKELEARFDRALYGRFATASGNDGVPEKAMRESLKQSGSEHDEDGKASPAIS
jgi:hypothetical protein